MLDNNPNVRHRGGRRHLRDRPAPARAQEFFVKYQDRVMFGTDTVPYEGLYRWFRFETADEYFDCCAAPRTLEIYGIDLPKEVLEKVYTRTPSGW